jgi:hypothetical protein
MGYLWQYDIFDVWKLTHLIYLAGECSELTFFLIYLVSYTNTG